jgi:hypothetical protein
MKNIFAHTNITELTKVADTAFAKSYPEGDANTPWAEIEPYTLDACRRYILPYIGRELYDDLAEKATDEASLTPIQTECLELLRRTVAYYAVMIFYPKKTTFFASSGISQSNSNRVSTPSIGAIKFSLWDITRSADMHLDLLLEFLEKQVADGESYFDIWKNNPAFNRGTTPFFRRTSDLNTYFNIFNSRSTFIALVSHINDICEDIIEPILCNDLFLDLASQITEGAVSPPNAKLLHLIRRAVAPLAIAKAAPLLSLVVESDGFKVVSSTDGMDRRDTVVKHHQAQIEALVSRCCADGESNINKLKKYLNDNLTEFSLFANSPCYKAAQARIENFGIQVLTDNGTSAFIFRRR